MKSIAAPTQVIFYSLIPLVGVLLFGWDWKEVVLLYWLESITLGITTIIQMLRTQKLQIDSRGKSRALGPPMNSKAAKIVAVCFFILHYGLYTLAYGIAIWALISGAFPNFTQELPGLSSSVIIAILVFWIIPSIVRITRSIVSRASNASLKDLFNEPYKRLLPLHIAIIVGAWAISTLNLPAATAIILILMKLLVDLKIIRSDMTTFG